LVGNAWHSKCRAMHDEALPGLVVMNALIDRETRFPETSAGSTSSGQPGTSSAGKVGAEERPRLIASRGRSRSRLPFTHNSQLVTRSH